MTSTTSLEGVKKAVFFPFQGKNWGIKILIGSAISLANYILPVIASIPLLGYYGQIMKGIILRDEDPELPEWNDWGALFMDGLKMLGVSIIYMLPSIVLMFGGYILMIVMNFAFLDSSSYSHNPAATTQFLWGSMLSMFGGMIVFWIGVLAALLTWLFLPPALANMIAKGDFGAAFRLKEWWPIFKSNFSGYLLMLALMMGLAYLLMIVIQTLYFTVVLCFLMPLAMVFLGFVLGAIYFSLFAVTYRDGVRNLSAAAEIKE